MATKAVTDDNFESDVLGADKPVLVDFWADWCGPCKQIAPALEELSDELGSEITIAKLNIEENPTTPVQFGVRNMLKIWHEFSRQWARLRVAAAKIHRHRNLMSSRQALDAWSLWIEMIVMSSRLKAVAERNLISRAFFEWFEVNGHVDHCSALSSVSLFREQFSEMLGNTPQHSPSSGARPASTPRNL